MYCLCVQVKGEALVCSPMSVNTVLFATGYSVFINDGTLNDEGASCYQMNTNMQPNKNITYECDKESSKNKHRIIGN